MRSILPFMGGFMWHRCYSMIYSTMKPCSNKIYCTMKLCSTTGELYTCVFKLSVWKHIYYKTHMAHEPWGSLYGHLHLLETLSFQIPKISNMVPKLWVRVRVKLLNFTHDLFPPSRIHPVRARPITAIIYEIVLLLVLLTDMVLYVLFLLLMVYPLFMKPLAF